MKEADGKTEKAFNVVGITIRTTNKLAVEEGTMSNLWDKCFVEQYLDKIPDKADKDIFAIYYDYENGKDGEYTLLLGCKVTSTKNVPKSMTIKQIPKQRYLNYKAEDN